MASQPAKRGTQIFTTPRDPIAVNQAGVYAIVHVSSGRRYIGSSSKMRVRWGIHRSSLRHGRHHNRRLQSDWDRHGEGAFSFVVMHVTENPRDLVSLENEQMDQARTQGFSLYNSAPMAGSCLGVEGRPTFDVKQAIELYQSGALIVELSKRFGVSGTTIRYHIRKHGIERTQERPTNEDVAMMCNMYESGSSIAKISGRFRWSTSCVRDAIVRSGGRMRLPSERRALRQSPGCRRENWREKTTVCSSLAWREWLGRLADYHRCSNVGNLIDRAAVFYAEKLGFEKPPRRLPLPGRHN